MELALDDIAVVYQRGGTQTRAVRGVSLRIREGQTLAVVGESGSGKTTIAKVAAGLQAATSGTLRWTGGEPAARARQVQMVFQHPVQSLDPMWTIRRSVQEPLRRAGVSRREADPRTADMITRVGLDSSVLDRHPRELSGGQAQRVAIARALIANPQFVILDEPTASLDQTIRRRILALLAELQTATGVGYLVISHDISSVRTLASSVAVMYRGLVVESGPAATILDTARHPYTRRLIAAVRVAVPRVGWPAPVRATAPGDSMECPVAATACAEHGPGLHRVGPDHLVACTTNS
jgi:ABC-type dipeptide/oligopeptide/nickel transport system ATPase subunit